MLKILNIVGARPNFMKIAPIHKIMEKDEKIKPVLVHTGQHYDRKMSHLFFEDLGLPKPDIYLGVGSGSHAVQTSKIMTKFEQVVLNEKPDLVLVVGDVNSTIACSLVASKLYIPVAHVEAGLRSFDRKMPEEINRILTDTISDFLFITEKSGEVNLLNEGINPDKIHFVGHVMIDSLIQHMVKSEASKVHEKINAKPGNYGLITLHRPSNVDNEENLKNILEAFKDIQTDIPLYFPMHPRTKKNMENFNLQSLLDEMPDFHIIEPLGYLDFLKMQKYARVIMTDSGGIQEESTFLKIPCITLRENTERPSTVELGTNILVGPNKEKILSAWCTIKSDNKKEGQIPPLWDGKAAERIVKIILEKLG